MNVVCQQGDLHKALAVVTRAVATRTALPVLSNILLVAENGKLRVAATNMEIAITTEIDAAVSEEGKLTVDARLLNDFVNTLPAGDVLLTVDPQRLAITVQSGRNTATINGLDAEDFPVIASVTPEHPILRLDAETVRQMIAQVEFSAASDESRPVLAGVLIRWTGDRLILAAADGYRLAVKEDRNLTQKEFELNILIPARAARELARLLGDVEGIFELQIAPGNSQLLVQAGANGFVSRLIEGNFPDFQRLIPTDFATEAVVDRDSLLNGVKRASYFARDSNDVLRVDITPSEESEEIGSLEVSANAPERGNSQSFVDASVKGPAVRIGFNSRFLAEALGALNNPQAMLQLNGQNQAAVIRVPGEDNYTNVIMPMLTGS